MSQPQPKRTIAEGRYLRLVDDDGWEYVQRRHCRAVVALVAATGDGRLVLIEQYRPSVKNRVIELPAGLVGDGADRDESLLGAARRELLEETGYEAGELLQVAAGPSSTGLTDEIVTFILARQLVKRHAGGGVEDERITVHEVPLGEVDGWLAERERAGRCVDPRVYIGLYFLRREGGLNA